MYPCVLIFVLSLLGGVVSECPDNMLSPRTGATEPAPWHAVMYSKLPDSWDMICGATLVTPTHVITAAHCFWTDYRRRSFNLSSYEIVLGKQCEDYESLEEDVQLKNVKNVTIHPWYRGVASSLQYDIAVVELDSAVTITSAVDVVHINRDVEDLPVGTSGTVVGWEGSRTSRSMKTLQLPYLELTECRDSLSELHALPSSDMFCIGSGTVRRRTCLEDAGAGFVYVHPTTEKKYLRGVVSSFLLASFTVRCQDQDYIGVTNLAESHIMEWIDQIIPPPAVPCPAIETSAAVQTVACVKGEDQVDCSLSMEAGSVAVLVCSLGYKISGKRTSKTAICSRKGTWTNEILKCEREDPCQLSLCGPNSQCSDVNGQAVCACLPDYIGTAPNCRPECSVTSDCAGNSSCTNGKCVDPCTGRCGQNAACTVVNTTVVCSCQSGYSGDPLTSCLPLPVHGKSHGQTYFEGQQLDASARRYLGCFQDIYSRPAISYTQMDKSNSPEQCVHLCAGFKYAGLISTVWCFCINDRPVKTMSQASCAGICPGDRTKTCGGGALDFYTVPPAPRPNIEYKGCFRDQGDRSLPGSSGVIYITNTAYQCASMCHGYKFAGTEFGNWCFCGDKLPTESLAENLCNSKCSGDDTKICGGYWALSVYEIV